MNVAARALALVLASVALVGAGYRWGATATDNKHAATAAKAIEDARAEFEGEIQRGNAAVTALQTERNTLFNSYMGLQEAFNGHLKRYPIVVRSSRAPGAAPGVAPAAPAAEPGAQPGEPAQGCAPPDVQPVVGHELVLSNSAVWMWNSALAGADQPAGACGLADPTEEACAAESGATLEDAWRNHAINAQLCAEDRLNHQRLIDYIRSKSQ